jgi:hypothetical protein
MAKTSDIQLFRTCCQNATLNAVSGMEVEIEVGMGAAEPADIDDAAFSLCCGEDGGERE